MDNSETIHERITQLVNKFGKGKNTLFASLIGSNEANVRGYKATIMPKFDFLEKIARNIDIDLKWLLTGEGFMLRSDQVQPAPQPVTQVDTPGEAVIYYKMYKEEKAEKESKIEELTAKMLQMAEELGSLKNQLSQYEPKTEGSIEKVKGLGHAKSVSTGKPSSPNANNVTSATAQ